MKITILATGKNRDKAITALGDEYLKRLQPHAKMAVVELPQAKEQTAESIKAAEAKAQLAKIAETDFVIALDERGEMLKTEQLAAKLEQIQTAASDIVIVIGGAEGLAPELLARANLQLSLSKLVFPHMLVRVIILEQLYRCFSLNSGHPYHRA